MLLGKAGVFIHFVPGFISSHAFYTLKLLPKDIHVNANAVKNAGNPNAHYVKCILQSTWNAEMFPVQE